jgi:hypothetical protein
MRKLLLSLLFVAISSLLTAQQALNNDAIVKLSKAGLSDDVIVSTINSSAGAYDTSADGLIALKSAGVSDKVVAALVTKAAAPTAQPAVAAPAAMDENDPMAQHDPGIYLLKIDHEGHKKLILIERAGAGHAKTANVWGAAFTYGISKAKVKAEVPGAHASTRTEEPVPVFYMYFPPTGNLGAADTITSPTQFSLLKLEEKSDHRETAIAKVGFASASAGTDEKRVIKFNAEKIRAYAYKVTPSGNLAGGEFAFIAATGMSTAGTGGSVAIYDFGVDVK